MSELVERTYRQVAELERAGVSRPAAFQQIAERDGASVSAISARYYAAAKAHGQTRARPSAPNGRTSTATSTSTSGESMSDALDRVVEILRDLIPIARSVESDAMRFRTIRELTDARD